VGGLQVLANVEGAEVFVGGTERGQASPMSALNLRDLPVGRVSVKVEAPGYVPATQALDIREGQWTQGKFTLVKPADNPVQPAAAQPAPALFGGLGARRARRTAVPAQGDGTALSRAALGGRLETVKAMVEGGEVIGKLDKWGWTALHWAVYYNQMPVVAYLLDHDADPDLQATRAYGRIKQGATPLIICAYFGFSEPMAALLQKRADRSIADSDGKQALDYATQFHFDECEELLRKP
jgi:hypothetical protein